MFSSIFPQTKDSSITERPDVIPFLHNADEHSMFAKVVPNKNSVWEPNPGNAGTLLQQMFLTWR